jgi:hypothetical protein
LEATSKGFVSQKLKPFVLQVNQVSALDFTLTVGGMDTVIQVEAVGNQVKASSTELAMTLEAKQIADLPLDGRNFTELFTAAPGVSPIVVGGSQSMSYTTGIGSAMIPSFNGQTNRSDLFIVDGILDVETFGNAYAVQPGIDYIESMKLESHNDSAEFGGSTGGTINVSTKSGTNALHGAAWEFNKSPGMQALAYFTPKGAVRTPFKQNQFGGTLGGPVVIPKLYHARTRPSSLAIMKISAFQVPETGALSYPQHCPKNGFDAPTKRARKMPDSEKHRAAEEVVERRAASDLELSHKHKYPVEEFRTFVEAARRYVEMTENGLLIHKSAVRAVNEMREYQAVERKQVPGEVLFEADRLECLPFLSCYLACEGDEPQGL